MEFSFPFFFGGFFFGVFVTLLVAIVLFQEAEAQCQKQNSVYDCEWSRSPFTPAQKDDAP